MSWYRTLGPGLLLEEQVERGFEHLLGGGAGERVREAVAGGGDLLEEPGRDGDVEAAEVGGQRLDVSRSRPPRAGWVGATSCARSSVRPLAGGGAASPRAVGRGATRSRVDRADGRNDRHHVPPRRARVRQDGRRHLPRLARRPAEEAGQHLGLVGGREDTRELPDGRQAELALPERRLHRREARQEPRRGEAQPGGPVRQPQLPGQEREEAGVAERLPAAPPVEVGEGQQEVGGGLALARREGGPGRRGGPGPRSAWRAGRGR